MGTITIGVDLAKQVFSACEMDAAKFTSDWRDSGDTLPSTSRSNAVATISSVVAVFVSMGTAPGRPFGNNIW